MYLYTSVDYRFTEIASHKWNNWFTVFANDFGNFQKIFVLFLLRKKLNFSDTLDINMPQIFESKSLGSICTLPSDKTIWVKADVYIRGSSLDNWISGIRVAIVLKDQSSAASKRLGP